MSTRKETIESLESTIKAIEAQQKKIEDEKSALITENLQFQLGDHVMIDGHIQRLKGVITGWQYKNHRFSYNVMYELFKGSQGFGGPRIMPEEKLTAGWE